MIDHDGSAATTTHRTAVAGMGHRVASALGMVGFGLFVLVGAAAALSISAWEAGSRNRTRHTHAYRPSAEPRN